MKLVVMEMGSFGYFGKAVLNFLLYLKRISFCILCLEGSGDTNVYLTFVYAKYSYILLRLLWQDLISFSTNISGPWIVGGDFIVVRSIKKCYGSALPSLPSR